MSIYARVKRVAAIAVGLVGAALFTAAPSAWADPAEVLTRTVTGNTRCIVLSGEIGCETYLPSGFLQGQNFPDADGNHNANIARITSGGQFEWRYGDIPGAHTENDVVLNYGRTYHLSGWTLSPTPDGTRFVNDATAHGMFVSVQNVSSF